MTTRNHRGSAVAEARFEARLHASLDDVAPIWRRLEAGGTAHPCQSLGWTRDVAAHLAAGAETFFVEVFDRSSGSPAMILPLAVSHRYGLRRIGWFSFGVCDYAAPALADGPDLSPDDCRAAWAAVKEVLPRADFIQIGQIPATVGRRANPLAALPQRRPTDIPAFGSAIDGDPETLLRRLCRSSTLRDMGKQRRRLERAGELRFSRASTPAEVEAGFAALVEQRTRRFAEMGRFDLLVQPRIQSFYRSAALAGLEGGPVRLFVLSVDGGPVATFYGLEHGAGFQGLILTMSDDKAWRTASPGVQIVAEALQWARGRGLTYFDLSVGDLPYKREFGLVRETLDEVVQPLSPQGFAFASALRAAAFAKARLREHPGARARIDRLRRRLRGGGPARPGVAQARNEG
ncbi:GNAT family N-acetyltransferase [Lichenibacterium dinghuense]|uniref:GNAT family N-acetyltransferase n=1 Tax=Lichenibacterium dinghuense TaxID=2895977 RepID=UPI001F3A977C|nr:GNAT family N-acetyltransferase [Lichenibacterium sp. 6Y81]